ncbi:PilW family protein [Clostridium paraputrificum]|uniref:PilW family protein n=1 Tax=Clostridium paraputrificum TaxID=29363 RepID=UPI003D339F1F
MKKSKGFTLVELIAVMAMSAIIGLVIMSLIISQNKMFFHVNNETISQDETRLAFSALEDSIRGGGNQTNSSSIPVNTIKIDTKDYSLDTVNGLNKGIVLYAFTQNEKMYNPDGSEKIDPSTGKVVTIDRGYAYVYYKKDTDSTGYFVYLKGNDSKNKLNQVSVISKDVKKVEITKSGGEYVVNLVIKKGTAEESFKNVITPRN